MGSEQPLMVVRADATPAVGMGHAMRCLALMQAWSEQGGKAVLLGRLGTTWLTERLQAEGIGWHALRGGASEDDGVAEMLELADATAPGSRPVVVIDGYHFGAELYASARAAGALVCALDDCNALPGPDVDVVLNGNAYAPSLDYQVAPECALLLGARWLLMRREFRAVCASDVDPASRALRVLVTAGGSDSAGLSVQALRALGDAGHSVPGLELRIVAGPLAALDAALVKALADAAVPVTLLQSADDMPAQMQWADIAVAAAGSTCWELALMGVPMLLAAVADNQTGVLNSVVAAGAALDCSAGTGFDESALLDAVVQLGGDADLRRRMGECGRALVDGGGALRVVRFLKGQTLALRHATTHDAALLYEWRNAPDVRSASLSTGPIEWDTHTHWLRQRLDADDCLLFIGHTSGGPVGQIRFDRSGGEVQVSVSVAAGRRGRGSGRELIEAGTRECMQRWHGCRVIARIRSSNGASLRAFEAVGYSIVGGGPALDDVLTLVGPDPNSNGWTAS